MSRRRIYALALGVEALALGVLDGRLHHDEVHQYLEPAHRMVWGYGTVAHEWHRGMRNTAAPSALAGLFAAARALGLDGPWALFALRHAAMAALSLAALGAAMDHVRDATDEARARHAGYALALCGPWAALAPRTLGESLSTFALLLGLRAWGRGRAASAGLAAGAAFVLRYPAGVASAAFALAAARGGWRPLGRFAIGLALPLVLLALLDLRAWGAPLASARAYAAFNLVHDRARIEYGARPWWFYGLCAAAFAPWPMLLGLRGPWDPRRAGLAGGAAALYLAVMGALAHKEPRFFLAAIPLLVVAAARSAAGTTPRATAALALVAAQGALVFGAWWSVGIFQGDIARAARWTSGRADLGALWVMNASHPGWTNLRREVPLRADPRERLEVNLRALDAAPPPPPGRRVYAVCDGRLRAGEGARCAEALRSRGFRAVGAHGRAAVFAR